MKNIESNRGWPLRLIGFFEQPPSNISILLSILGLTFFTALVVIGFLAIGWILADLLSGDQKRAADATKAALPVLAGVIGLPLIIWRLLILDRQTRISDEKTQIDRETHYTSIFSRSVEQLGQTRELKKITMATDVVIESTQTVPNIEVRPGGLFALERLLRESEKDQKAILETICAYARENSPAQPASEEFSSEKSGHDTKPKAFPLRSDVQAAITKSVEGPRAPASWLQRELATRFPKLESVVIRFFNAKF